MSASPNAVDLVVICGWPVSGKSTFASALAEYIHARHLDIDSNVRAPVFGTPDPFPNRSGEAMKKDEEDMRGSYELLLHATDLHLRFSRRLVITATFSRRMWQDRLLELLTRYPGKCAKAVRCAPSHDTREFVENRLALRNPGPSNVTDYRRYVEVKSRYETPNWPCLVIDTYLPFEDTFQDVIRHLEKGAGLAASVTS